MRQIGTIPSEADANRLADYLLTLGITTRLDKGEAGWALWVHHEDKVEQARAELEAFLDRPTDAKYSGHAATARALRRRSERAQREHYRQSFDVRYLWSARDFHRCPLTFLLIGASLVVSILMLSYRYGGRVREALYIASYQRVPLNAVSFDNPPFGAVVGNEFIQSDLPADLKRGEVWRLITPIFLHFGVLHLLFNMSFLYQLGGEIEARCKTPTLLTLVLASAVLSNLAQYLYTGNPLFGGMSGVDLALFGFVWMKGLYEPELGMGLSSGTILFLMAYLALSMTGRLGPIAHAAHLAGLAVGILAGVGPHLFNFASPSED